VYPSTQYDFNSDANGIETSSDWGSGYAVYLTNLETIKDKDLYPTMLELIIKDKNSVSATGEWMVNRGDFLLKSEPDIQ
jgi:hypothetical protein